MAVAILGIFAIPWSGCICTGDHSGQSPVVKDADGSRTSGRVTRVLLYPDGHLETGDLWIGRDQIAILAKELEGSTVHLQPSMMNGKSVTLDQALHTRDELLKNGVKRVVLPLGER